MTTDGNDYPNGPAIHRDSVVIVDPPMIYKLTTPPKHGSDTRRVYRYAWSMSMWSVDHATGNEEPREVNALEAILSRRTPRNG